LGSRSSVVASIESFSNGNRHAPPGLSFYAIQNLASLGILVAITAGTFWVWQERRAANFR
jgi:hypothetical protein